MAWRGSEGNQYAVSDNGVFVSVSGSTSRYERRLVWVGRDGRLEPLAQRRRARTTETPSSRPTDSEPPSTWMAGTISVWIYDFVRATLTPLRTGSGSNQAPRWSADGTRIVYRGTRTGLRNLWWKRVDDAAEGRAFNDR